MSLEELVEQIAERVFERKVAEAAKVTPIDQVPTQSSEPLIGARAAAAHLSISERQLRASVRFKLSELESHARVEERRLKAV